MEHFSCYLFFNKTPVDRAEERAEKQSIYSSGDAEKTDINTRKRTDINSTSRTGIQCLGVIVPNYLLEPYVESIFIDGSFLAHILKPTDPTFLEYAMNTFANKVNNTASTHKRTDHKWCTQMILMCGEVYCPSL